MSKAFDRMPNHTLLLKLASGFNINGALWRWIKDFLVGRHQRVTFVGRTSSWVKVKSGVAQGSVLGLLLLNHFAPVPGCGLWDTQPDKARLSPGNCSPTIRRLWRIVGKQYGE